MFVVRPVLMPLALTGVENGRIPLGQLSPAHGGGALHSLAARAWVAMVYAAAQDGVRLRPVSPGDTYRTYGAQEQLFRRRYTPGLIPGRPTKRWDGSIWSLRPGMAPAAVPGTSNHGWGLAVDVATGGDTAVAIDPSHGQSTEGRNAYRWLVNNYERFGWSHEYTNPSDEPWHIRYVAGDNVPQAVHDYEHPIVVPPGPTLPPRPPRSVTMLLLDLYPSDPARWCAFQCDGKAIWHARNGKTIDVLQRGGVPRVELSEDELINMLTDVRAQGSCPVPNPSAAMLAAWNASALGQ